MQLGMIGAGRMGSNMVLRLLERGHECVVYDAHAAALEPGIGDTPRTAGRQGGPSTAEEGYLHCGAHGAGHFVKMVHNGIEYGLMAAYAEGLNILKRANIGRVGDETDPTPLREPER